MTRLFPDYTPSWETDDHRLLRAHAAHFIRNEVVPHEQRWADQHAVDRDLWTKAGAAGLLCLEIPERYGGGGGDFGHEAVVAEELAAAHDTAFGFGVHSTIVAHYVAQFASEEQKRRWLPTLAAGTKVIGIAMTEPDTGSDLQSVRTTAVRDGDDFVINGSKTFISNATHSDLMVIVAKTDASLGARGISLFVAESDHDHDAPGFSRGRVLNKVGQHGQDTRELFFDDLRVPAANLLGGEEGQGFFQLMQQLPRERLIIAVGAAAMAEAAVVEAIEYAKQRRAFGRAIIDFQNTRFVLAECKTEALALRTFVDHSIQAYLDGKLDAAGASMAKYYATDKQVEITDRCVQIFGGYGYMMEYPIAQMYAAARVQKIYGGTNEIMKELIGRSL